METKKSKKYIAPEIKIIKVLVEQGFTISGVTNGLKLQEKHILEKEAEW